ncbi:zwei Ig domain protein zig-8 [Scaptodrosophila lebanonensis]|uniref:Zwei Ig domain protein zig-8 n=1 Tax=Drosophila lebanonensis TaxID=7225 RepID=A0A6J2UC83_DROLE|nr:zwei Ig domain protein zig-8 [Scaptodrosophila lebanonensis]
MKKSWNFRIIFYILCSREILCQHDTFENNHNINTSNYDDHMVKLSKPFDRGPYFDTSATKNVTSLVGKTGHLNCRIKNLGNKTVSWIRHRDLHLLTVAESTYTSDQRFSSIYNKQTGDWSLQIKFPQKRDSGIYECQVSTSPPVGYTMVFSVVEPITTIPGGPELYIDLGSTVNLTCIVKHLPDPPLTVHWTHNNEEINYDSPRGGVSVITEKGDLTTSYLLIQRARISDSGRYSCLPSNANVKSVNVHILNGDHPAAVQRAPTLKLFHLSHVILLIVYVYT